MKYAANYMSIVAVVLSLCLGYPRLKNAETAPAPYNSEAESGVSAESQCSKFVMFFRNGHEIDVDPWRRNTLYTMLRNYPEEMIEALHRADMAVRLNVYREIETLPSIDGADMELLYAVVTASRGDMEIRASIIHSLERSMQYTSEYGR